MKILIINGPNLNMLGRREPEVYGDQAFEPYFAELCRAYPGTYLRYVQTNCEGTIIDELHAAYIGNDDQQADAVILNAGAYTHYSYAIADAIRAVSPLPVIEVHISQPAARESFRHESVIAPVCRGSISGFGLDSYRLAVEAVLNQLK